MQPSNHFAYSCLSDSPSETKHTNHKSAFQIGIPKTPLKKECTLSFVFRIKNGLKLC